MVVLAAVLAALVGVLVGEAVAGSAPCVLWSLVGARFGANRALLAAARLRFLGPQDGSIPLGQELPAGTVRSDGVPAALVIVAIAAVVSFVRRARPESTLMSHFTPIASAIGGILIGLAATVVLAVHGKVAGISGIFGGLLQREGADRDFRITFVFGLFAGGLALMLVRPSAFPGGVSSLSPVVIVVAGLLVGFGTRLGSGCTSGHGVCGLSRLSLRSLVATLTFMLVAGATTYAAHAYKAGLVR